MAKLKNYDGHYCESDYEYAFIGMLEQEGWQYLPRNKIDRPQKDDVLIAEDFKTFITMANADLTEEVSQIYDNVRFVGSESDFATLRSLWLDGGRYAVHALRRIARMVSLIDFERPNNNIFRVVNQLSVEYVNNDQRENRRPDVLLYINGLPLCVVELKNPADANATIYDAWEQINSRY